MSSTYTIDDNCIDDKYLVSSRASSNACEYNAIAERVSAVDPNGGRCLIENTAESIQFFHLLPREAMNNDDLMDSLEWSWNMRRGELNLDNEYNVVPVTASVKAKLESGQWLLVPEDPETMTEFQRSTLTGLGENFRRRNFPKCNKIIHSYKIVSVVDDDHSVLPTLRSHVLPHFVISAAGYQVYVQKNAALTKTARHNPLLDNMIRTYYSWTEPVGLIGNVEDTYIPYIGPRTKASSAKAQLGREFRLNPNYITQRSMEDTLSRIEFGTVMWPKRNLELSESDSDTECENTSDLMPRIPGNSSAIEIQPSESQNPSQTMESSEYSAAVLIQPNPAPTKPFVRKRALSEPTCCDTSKKLRTDGIRDAKVETINRTADWVN